MKTFLIGIPLSAILIVSAFAGKKADKEEAGLRGLVRTVHTESVESSNKSGQWIEEVQFMQTISYDQKGNRVGRINYNPDGSFRSEEKGTITYDDQGRITEINSTDNLRSFAGKKIYKYDSKGNISEEINYINVGSIGSRNAYVYDENGNISEELHYAHDDSFVSRKVYKYAPEGYIAEEAVYHSRGKLLRKKVVAHDANGKKTVVHYDGNGSTVDKQVFTYNANGNISEILFYKPDGSLDGKTTYDYEYDSIGNWIKQRDSHKGKAEWLRVTRRTITYYPSADKM